jgi:hypothetical protein
MRVRAADQGRRAAGFFDALVMLTEGEPWMPAST